MNARVRRGRRRTPYPFLSRMKKFVSLSALALALALPTFLVARQATGPVSPAILYKPTPRPDRVILTWAADPATTQAVTWRTDDTVTKSVAQIIESDAGPKFEPQAQSVDAKTEALSTDLGFTAHYHSVVFRNLKPSTAYTYRVGDGQNWSEWFTFKTASAKAEPFSFIYFGDVQNGIRSLWSRVFRRAYSDHPEAKFFLYAGDLVNRANQDSDWAELHEGPGWVNGCTPTIPTPGNHETEKDAEGIYRLSRHWRPEFTLPENGPRGLEETCYTLDYQGVRIISLNSNERHQDQAQWLEGQLKDNPMRWTVVTFHHPVFSSAERRDNPEIRAIWKPIFDKYKVDLVLQGHDHTYARGGLKNVPDHGTMYVVSVSGSKMYDLNPQSWMNRRAEDTQFYQVIRVDKDKLTYEARMASGELYDAFELRKRSGQTNQLVEKTPRTPERRRKTE